MIPLVDEKYAEHRREFAFYFWCMNLYGYYSDTWSIGAEGAD